jgi:hypothetical protein
MVFSTPFVETENSSFPEDHERGAADRSLPFDPLVRRERQPHRQWRQLRQHAIAELAYEWEHFEPTQTGKVCVGDVASMKIEELRRLSYWVSPRWCLAMRVGKSKGRGLEEH